MRLSYFLCLTLALGCGGSDPKPGFQNLGGSGGSGATSTSASMATSSAAHTSATVGSNVTSSTVGSSSNSSTVSTGAGCVDTGPGEPNGTETTAYDLGTIGDCDDMGDSIAGVLNGPQDVDWYKFHGIDMSSVCSVDPARTITSSGSVRLCKFIQCDGSETNNFTCPSGSTAATSPEGRPGCCGTTSMDIDLTCGTSDLDADDAMVFIRVDNPNALPCPTYSVAYHY